MAKLRLIVERMEAYNKKTSQGCIKFTKDFGAFISNPRVFGFAIAIVIGDAVDSLVESFVVSFISPFIGLAMGGIDLSSFYLIMKHGDNEGTCSIIVTPEQAQSCGAAVLSYGSFLNDFLRFLITLGVVFSVVKLFHKEEYIKKADLCRYCYKELKVDTDEIDSLNEQKEEIQYVVDAQQQKPQDEEAKEEEIDLSKEDKSSVFHVCSECNIGILNDAAKECHCCWNVIDAAAVLCRHCGRAADKVVNPMLELESMLECEEEVPVAGQRLMAVEIQWMNFWLNYITNEDIQRVNPPSKISNDILFCPTSRRVMKGLKCHKHYRLINCNSWDIIYRTYGGGPAIAIEIPHDVQDSTVWMKKLKLDKHASILT